MDVVKAAKAAPGSTPVIVVSRVVDIPLYLDVLESGAYDFIVPPLTSAELAPMIRAEILREPGDNGGAPYEASWGRRV